MRALVALFSPSGWLENGGKMQNYGIAKAVLFAFELFAWITIAFSAFAFGEGLSLGLPIAAFTLAASGVFAGAMLIAVAQIGKAQIHTAENSSQILRTLLDMKSAAVSPTPSSGGLSWPDRSSDPAGPSRRALAEYRGYRLFAQDDGVMAAGRLHVSEEDARKYLDRMIGDNP